MTAKSKKSEQTRLDSCDLKVPKWAKIRQKLGQRACRPLKINYLGADTDVRVENTHENGHPPHNTKLLGKYPLKYGP